MEIEIPGRYSPGKVGEGEVENFLFFVQGEGKDCPVGGFINGEIKEKKIVLHSPKEHPQNIPYIPRNKIPGKAPLYKAPYLAPYI